MKKLISQPIIYTQTLLTKAKNFQQQHKQFNDIIDAQQYKCITPRIFPNSKIPIKISTYRKIKQFISINLNQIINNVNWYEGQAELALVNYVFCYDFVIEYGCESGNIRLGKVKGRAYCDKTKQYEEFFVQKYNRDTHTFNGTFIIKQFNNAIATKLKEQNIHRAMICFDFQDPIIYANQITIGIKRRKKVLQLLKYQFYIDNMDLQGAPIPSHKIINKIKQLAMAYIDSQCNITAADLQIVINHYKRVMNQILFRHEVMVDQLPIYLPNKYRQRNEQPNNLRKKLKIKKNNKIITLVPKSTKQRIQDLQTKILFINHKITSILIFLNQKLVLKPPSPLFLPITQTIIQKYLIEQQISFDYCYSAINQYIIDPLASYIRSLINQYPQGWFRMYQNNRMLYLDGKLRRMFVLINNILRDWVIDQIDYNLGEFLEFLQKWTPQLVEIYSLHSNMTRMKRKSKGYTTYEKPYTSIIIIDLVIQKGILKLSHGSQRVNKLLKKLIISSLQKFSRIPSPQPIVLKQLFGGYKNQQGIKVQLPIYSENLQNYAIYPKILTKLKNLNEQIDKICWPLVQYQNIITKTTQLINLPQVLSSKQISDAYTLSQIIHTIKNYTKLQQLMQKQFIGQGSCLGFFFINYSVVKNHIFQLLRIGKQTIRHKLLAQNKKANLIYFQSIKQIQHKLHIKPKNVQQLIQKQNLMKNLDQILRNPNRQQMLQIRALCQQFQCAIDNQQCKNQIQIDKIINSFYKNQTEIKKQYQSIKKQQLLKIQNSRHDIQQSINLLKITKSSLQNEINQQQYASYAQKIRYIVDNIKKYKQLLLQIHKKQQLLQVQNKTIILFQQIVQFQKQCQPYQLLWLNIQKWKNLSNVWLNQPIGSYQLKQSQTMLKNMIANLKKASHGFNNSELHQLQQIANKYKIQIQKFQPNLKLLRLLKKKGLTRKHLQQIGIQINLQIQNITLSQAIHFGLFGKIQQIQAISNDAWNKFSLQQTLDRLLKQIYQLKFKLNSYKDRKKNDIYIIVNYRELIDSIDTILNNIQAVQFNPMVKMYQAQIKQIYDKSLYINNTLVISQQFQKILVQLHPIFDSTDIVKQIPAQNKKFAKVLRIWLQIVTYIKNICSVHDACNSQNMYQKIKSLFTSIQNVKKQLINYLQQKRKGFSRFYLLSNSQMFQLFSATSDIYSVNSLIPKLFDSVVSLNIDNKDNRIVGISSIKNCILQLIRSINYKGVNIQNWLNSLQKQIKSSIKQIISKTAQQSYNNIKWLNLIQNQQNLPQILYLLYQINSTQQLQSHLTNLKQFKYKNTKILQSLVQRKQKQNQKKLQQKSNIILCSIIILIISKLDIADRLMRNNIHSIDDFQWKKLIKIKYVSKGEKYDKTPVVYNLNYESQYGYEFLGVFSRLVITNLTEKTQVVYFLAQKYSLGAAAAGPAGTGKSQTTKDIAKLIGKTCLIYNCSQNFHQSTFLRLLKGLVITGLWMCFDQFNRLSFKILSIAAQQVSHILKFRSYGHRIQFSFMGEPIWLQPSFQICITYNANYQGRRSIPKNLNQLFRTVALILPDQYTICQALLYSNGYSKGDQLAKIVVDVFKKCKLIWCKQQLYDFGLRALRSIINMSSSLYLSRKQNQQNSIIEALKILNCPKMKTQDSQLFLKIVYKEFSRLILPFEYKKQEIFPKLSTFHKIINIRDGILLCGQPLSGKQILLEQFKNNFKQWQISTIYHDVLTVDQIYGQLDPTTKLWRDGFFTNLVRNNVNAGQNRSKYLIILNGSVYSQWIQNLNSFLDATRKLSLSSGQSISVPNTLKLIISCTDLQKASPATITRFGIINNEPLKYTQLIKKCPRFPKKMLQFFQQLQQQIKNQYLANINPRYILNWALDYLQNGPINYDTFVFYLAIIYQGLLTQTGKQKFSKLCTKYQSVPYSAFDYMLKINGQPTLIQIQFKKYKNYQQSNDMLIQNSTKFQQIFIPTLRSYKLTNIIQNFISPQKLHINTKILLIIGQPNIGKTRIVNNFLNNLSKQKNKNVFLYLTRKTTGLTYFQQLSAKLTRKSNTKLGGNPGVSVNIWIQDINMPISNQFDIIQTAQILRLICCEDQWYNYKKLSFQMLEDIKILADAKTNYFTFKNPLNFNPRFYRHIQPIFCSSADQRQMQTIFKQITEKILGNRNINRNKVKNYSNSQYNQEIIKQFVSISDVAIKFYWGLMDEQIFDKNFIKFNLNDLYRSLKGFLSWKLPNNKETASQLFQYQLSRNIISKISSKKIKNDISQHLSNYLSKFIQTQKSSAPQQPQFPLFHNLQKSNLSKLKCEKITNIAEFTNNFQCVCDEYKILNHQSHSIIVFPEMIQYLIKIYRTLLLDYTHTGIVGMSKCGKDTLIKLASYLISSDIYNIKQSNDNQFKDWQEGIKSATKNCYKNKNISLLIIKNKHLNQNWCAEDLNKLLNTMYLPHLYSQADIQQMIYMIQSDLVRKNIAINKQSMWNQFLAYLKQKLHVVLLLNPTFDSFKATLAQYPSIAKHTTFFYLDQWPKQALYLIAKLEMPNLGFSLDILPQIHQYCKKLCENSKLSILDSIWEGMYFDFITFFIKIYDKNLKQLLIRKNKYQQSQKVIEQTQDQLQKTKNKIKKLQPAIILIQNQTAKTVKNLQIQRKNAQQTNQELQLKNAQFQRVIKQSRIIKTQLQAKVGAINIQIAKAWQNVSLIKPSHISQVKALANPSQFIKTVLAALVILTYEGPVSKQIKQINGHNIIEQNYFETAKKHVLSKDAKSICRLLIEFKRQNVTKQMFSKLQQKCLTYKRWSQQQAKSANKAIYYFFLWVQAVANQYRIFEQTKPLRDQLQKISTILTQKQLQVSTIKKQLDYYYGKISQYEGQHKTKKQALQQYRIQIRIFQRMLNRGQQLLKQISGQKQKWANYLKEINVKIKNSFGDSIFMATTMVYMSPHVYQIRKKIKQHLLKLCKKWNIQCTVTGLHNYQIAWYLTREQQQIYQSFQINQNQFLIDNIKIKQNSSKVILLIDPEQQGIKLMKNLSWQNLQSPIDKLTEFSPNLVRTLQSAIMYGRIVFIEIDGSFYNSSLRFIINPQIIGQQGQQQIKSGDKTILIHQNYRLYLYTTVYPYSNKGKKSGNYSMQLLTNIQIINFKMTFQQLQQRILQIIINTQLPLLKAKIQQIFRVNIKDTLTLTNIQQKLLQTFSSQLSAQQILQSDQIINSVIHSNRLYKQISARVQQSKLQTQQIEQQKKPYYKKAKQTCLIYQNMQRLKLVSVLYAYSYQWFIQLFQANVYQFYIALYQQISKALKNDQKIVVAILIAEILHPNLPWKCLFNVHQNSITKTIYTTHQEEEQNFSQSSVNIDDQDTITPLQNMPKKLPVPQSVWNSIVARIKQVSKYLYSLQNNFNEKPGMFVNLIIFSQDRIFQAIPNQYSNIDYFYRILLISCFRPQCVINLLKQWLNINMGQAYTQINRNISTLVTNTKPYRPIIALLSQSTFQCLTKIRQIYQQSQPKQQIFAPIANFYFTSLDDCIQFDTLIKSAIVNNGWVIIQSISSNQVLTYIKSYFQEIVILPQKRFRLWIVVVENQATSATGSGDFSIGERFSQFCDKVRISTVQDFYKGISASFHKFQQMVIVQSDFFQRSKKKLMISQLCILHHLLSQFSDRYTYLSEINKISLGRPHQTNSMLTLTQWDLKLLIQQIFPYKIQQFSKKILQSQLICNLTYGSQVSTFYLENILYANSLALVSDIITQRSIFFQTLWCDEKFPKDNDQFEHEIKNNMNKKRYLDMFGLDYTLFYKIKANQYQKICQFYGKTVFHQGKGISNKLLQKLLIIRKQLNQIKESLIVDKIITRLQQFKQTKQYKNGSQYNDIYNFCHLQLIQLFRLYNVISSDVNNFQILLQQNAQIVRNTPQQLFMLNIYSNNSPWSVSHRPVTIDVFIRNFINRYHLLYKFLGEFNAIDNMINCGMIGNWKMFQMILKQIWGLQLGDQQKYKLIFVGLQEMDKVLPLLNIYGFELPQQQSEYPQQKIYSGYGQQLSIPFKIINRHKISQILTQKSKQKNIFGYALLQDLFLLNCQTQQQNNHLSIKLEIVQQQQQLNNTLFKSIMSLALTLKSVGNVTNKSKTFRTLMQQKLKGILLLVRDDQKQKYQKYYNIFCQEQSQNYKLVPIPCYQYALMDISQDNQPVSTIYTLVSCKSNNNEKIQAEIVRKNIHFSLRP